MKNRGLDIYVFFVSILLVVLFCVILFSPHTEKGKNYGETFYAFSPDQDFQTIRAAYWYLDNQISPTEEGWRQGIVIHAYPRSRDMESIVVFADHSVGPILVRNAKLELFPPLSYVWFKLDDYNYAVQDMRVIKKNLELNL